MTIEELKQAYEAATPGPWYADNRGDEIEIVGKTDNAIRYGVEGEWNVAKVEAEPFEEEVVPAQANARLIVEAVNNLPDLLKVAKAADDLVHCPIKRLGGRLEVPSRNLANLRKALEAFK